MPDFSISDILARGFEQRKPYLSQPMGFATALPMLGGLAQTAAQTGLEYNKRMTVLGAQKDYSDYLEKVRTNTATPEDHRRGSMAALSLGLTPPQASGGVSPEIWQQIQAAGGFKTSAPGTKENVQAGETLARIQAQRTEREEAEKGRKERQRLQFEYSKEKTRQAQMFSQKKTDEQWWTTAEKEFNPLNARRGTLLGQAALGNSRADRALIELNKNPTTISPQLKSLIQIDLAGIMQGGSPHESAMRAAGYDTLFEDFARLKQKITGTPSKAEIPGIIAELKSVISTIKEVDNKIIEDNMNIFEVSNKERLDRYPDKWNNLRGLIMGTTSTAGETPTPRSPVSPEKPKTLSGSTLSGIDALRD